MYDIIEAGMKLRAIENTKLAIIVFTEFAKA
jgi:hypothetical protein